MSESWYSEKTVRGFSDSLAPGDIIAFSPRWEGDEDREGTWMILALRKEHEIINALYCVNLGGFVHPSFGYNNAELRDFDIKEMVELQDGAPPYRVVGHWDPAQLRIAWITEGVR